ncbi:hypothetical protein PUY80_13465 [Plantibacter flavus]|uniref:hypothetical protein n=1 Tax=Plantibacter flavus TaxID=150123 RepID=UPI002378CBBA|nr:hypothetical protein [Plantibacter flavus]MDD9153579.1 hypothetical protein [Plantibacter flavus]
MTIGYRAILRLNDDEDATEVANEQLRSWLGSKTVGNRNGTLLTADWNGTGSFELGSTASLRVVEVSHDADGSHRQRATFTETNAVADFTIAISSISLPNAKRYRETLVIEASRSEATLDEAVLEVAPPNIVRSLLERVEIRDGSTILHPAPRIVHRWGIEEVVDAILDPDRLAAVIVAGSLGAEADGRLVQLVTSLTRRSVGVATSFVLAADALDAFNEAMPDSLQVGAGRVRTFEPDVDPDYGEEGLRHRVLGPETFARNILGRTRVTEALQQRHAASTRRRFLDSELPHDVRRSLDVLDREAIRLDRELRVDARVSARTAERHVTEPLAGPIAGPETTVAQPNAPDIDAEIDATVETVTPLVGTPDGDVIVRESVPRSIFNRISSFIRTITGQSEISEDTLDAVEKRLTRQDADLQVLQELLDESTSSVESLRSQLAHSHAAREELELEAAVEAEDARHHLREARVLRERLVRAERFDDLYVQPEEETWAAPGSIQELLLRLSDTKSPTYGVIAFTGDESLALAVEARDPVGRYAGHFWDYIRVLYDYARARSDAAFAGNVHTYLTDDSSPAGHKCTPTRHAPRESDQTMARWGDERVFPVPPEVHPDGRVIMGAHFKPTNENTFAPRMHYLDDTNNTGKIYIGYIGKHLTNTKTKNV